MKSDDSGRRDCAAKDLRNVNLLSFTITIVQLIQHMDFGYSNYCFSTDTKPPNGKLHANYTPVKSLPSHKLQHHQCSFCLLISHLKGHALCMVLVHWVNSKASLPHENISHPLVVWSRQSYDSQVCIQVCCIHCVSAGIKDLLRNCSVKQA